MRRKKRITESLCSTSSDKDHFRLFVFEFTVGKLAVERRTVEWSKMKNQLKRFQTIVLITQL